MRDPKRIDDFCNQLAKIWKTKCPDLRFGQLIVDLQVEIQSKDIDIFFAEEKEMLDFIKTHFENDTSAAHTDWIDKFNALGCKNMLFPEKYEDIVKDDNDTEDLCK